MCKLTRFIYLLIPIVRFRGFLIRKHLGDCSSCQKKWGIDQHMQQALAKPDWIVKEGSFWPRVQARILSTEREETKPSREKKISPFPVWQWVTVGFALFILIGISYWITRKGAGGPAEGKISTVRANAQVHIIHAKIQGKIAKPYIYQTPKNLFIWFDEMPQEED